MILLQSWHSILSDLFPSLTAHSWPRVPPPHPDVSPSQVEKNMYENLLTSNLYKRRDQLLNCIDEIGMSERKQEFDSKKAEFQQFTTAMDQTKKR